MNVIVNSLLVNYERQGKGRTILLVHGWGDTLKTFHVLVKELAQTYEIITLDLPGFGGSQPPTGAWSLEEYARFVTEFLQKIGIKDLYAILGHSNGGAIAIKGLANKYFTAGRLILMSSAGIRARDRGRKLVWKTIAKAGKVATAAMPASTRQKLRQKLYKTTGSDYLVVPGMQETFKKVVNEDLQSDVMLLELPTMIINGSEDTATPPAYAEIFHRAIADSQLRIVEGAGHFVHQERTDEVAASIKEFLK